MLGAIEKRFGDKGAERPIQWLTDNGSAYTAHETRQSVALRAMEWQKGS